MKKIVSKIIYIIIYIYNFIFYEKAVVFNVFMIRILPLCCVFFNFNLDLESKFNGEFFCPHIVYAYCLI